MHDVSLAHSPSAAARSSVDTLEYQMQGGAVIPFGIPSVDEQIYPAKMGELWVWLALPGHGKTSGMYAWAKRIEENYLPKNHVVAYVTAEDLIDDMITPILCQIAGVPYEKVLWNRLTPQDMQKIKDAATRYAMKSKIWTIGVSGHNASRAPIITPGSIRKSLDAIINERRRPAIVFVDYLQLLMPDTRSSDRAGYTAEIVRDLKHIAMEYKCPVVLGSQVVKEIADLNPPIPTPESGQWSSSIGQFANRTLASVLPFKVTPPGGVFGKDNPVVITGYNQCLLVVHKQKKGAPNKAFWVHYDPGMMTMDEADERSFRSREML